MKAALALIAVLMLGTCTRPASVLEQILAEGELRVVTRNSPSTYYLGAAGPLGPEYDLATRFAAELGVKLFIYSVPTVMNVMDELASGRAHIAAASLTRGQPLPPHASFGPPFQEVKEHLVYRQSEARPRSLDQANRGHIEVVAGSAHAATLEQLLPDHPELVWVENPEAETEELLYRLSRHEFDYTIADSNEFAIARAFHPEIRIAFDLTPGKSLAWAVDGRDPSLLNRTNAFFAALKGEGRLASILDRYYSNKDRFNYLQSRDFMFHIQSRLPGYRDWFQQAAAEVGVDWRLIAAIGYQESQWDPTATSPTGVRGMMMLTEETARGLEIADRLDPRSSIFGGARYIVSVREKIPERIPEPDRTWMALAAYNVGFGHLEDARILTQMHGKNPDRWEDVREHLPLLTQERWFTQVKRGYARGWEPVRFVQNIQTYMAILDWVASSTGRPASRPPDPDDDPVGG